MVNEMVAVQALHWGKASWMLTGCLSYGSGSSWLYLIYFPTTCQTSQLLLLPWEALYCGKENLIEENLLYKVDEQRDDCICITQAHPFLAQCSTSQGHFK